MISESVVDLSRFQFGTNWAYYSHYVGDIFGAPLAIEGLMAFFLRINFYWFILLWLGSLIQSAAFVCDMACSFRLEYVGIVDFSRKWLDAKPRWFSI